ncbi:MAG: hypothetical protein HRU14_12965 [Planctomycetes bacterium]|nr:hypothetical protein [Planctomycetota bacterium]
MANVVTTALDGADVAHPGHLAVRCLSGLGAACIILLFAWIAGPGRRAVGAAIAIPLVATRTFMFEAGVGESLHMACAAAVAVLWLASRPGARSLPVAISVVVALLLRQDSVLMIPAVAVVFAWAQPTGTRLRRTSIMIGAAGLTTLALYVVAWRVSAPDRGLDAYLFSLASDGWVEQMAGTPDGGRLLAHFAVSGVAVVGQQWDLRPIPHLLVGIAYVVLFLVAGRLLRGGHATGRFGTAVLMALALRVPFFTWFDHLNHEWWLLPLVLLAAFVAAWARGEDRTAPALRCSGWIVLALMTAGVFVAHLPSTLALRDRSVVRARDIAIAAGSRHTNCRYVSFGAHAHTAFHVVGQSHVRLNAPPERAREELEKMLAGAPVPTVLVVDRFIGTGMPYFLRRHGDPLAPTLAQILDNWKPTGGERLFRKRGRVVAIGWDLD